jgi:hypothetical protein
MALYYAASTKPQAHAYYQEYYSNPESHSSHCRILRLQPDSTLKFSPSIIKKQRQTYKGLFPKEEYYQMFIAELFLKARATNTLLKYCHSHLTDSELFQIHIRKSQPFFNCSALPP